MGPRYGIELKSPRQQPPHREVLDAEAPQDRACRERDDEAGDELHFDEALDLLIDLVEDLHRHPLFRECRSGDLDDLALVEIAGDEQEVDEEEDHGKLPEEAEEAHAADPDVIRGSERGLDDLHALELVASRS